MGHLARLAVAFSPPERTLTLNQIEKVDVICVKEDSIEIQAILCEHGGSVSLQVPVKFPNMCHSSSSSTTSTSSQSTALEGCVMDNLDALDVTATSLIQVAEETKANHQVHDQLLLLSNDDNNNNNVPSWWISPSSSTINDPTTMSMECQHIQNLLNDDEFQSDIIALSQDALMLWQKQQQQQEGQQQQQHDYQVLQAKVTMVGPAGLCFKVRVQDRQQQQQQEYYYDYYNNNNGQGHRIHVLNVVHPFGDIQQTTQELRAAVLGAVSAAEGF